MIHFRGCLHLADGSWEETRPSDGPWLALAWPLETGDVLFGLIHQHLPRLGLGMLKVDTISWILGDNQCDIAKWFSVSLLRK